MIGWPSCCLRLNTAEAQPRQIKLIDKNIDRPNRIVLAQIVIQSLGKQRALTAIIPNDKARHRILPANHRGMISFRSVFTQAGPARDIATLSEPDIMSLITPVLQSSIRSHQPVAVSTCRANLSRVW